MNPEGENAPQSSRGQEQRGSAGSSRPRSRSTHIALALEHASAFTHLGERLSGAVALHEAIDAALDATYTILSADLCELNLLDPTSGNLTPHRRHSPSAAHFIDAAPDVYHLGEGYTGWLLEHGRGLLVPDIRRRAPGDPKPVREELPFRSYVGVQLTAGGERFGTLEAAHFEPLAFGEASLELIALLGTMTALALQRIQQGLALKRGEAELARQTEILRLTSQIQDLGALVTELSAYLARSLGAPVAGFMHYDPQAQSFRALEPFHGLTEGLPAGFRIWEVPPDGPLAAVWASQTYWLASAVEGDSLLERAGLAAPLVEAGIHNLLIAPLQSGEHRLGILLAANKPGEGFGEFDADRIVSFATLCAPLIEAALSLHSSKAQQEPGQIRPGNPAPALDPPLATAEPILLITTELSSGLDLDKMLSRVLEVLCQSAGADRGAILLTSPEEGQLMLRASWGAGTRPPPGGRPMAQNPDQSLAGWVIAHRQPVLLDDLSQDDRWVPFTEERQPLLSTVAAPLTVGEEVLGAILLLSHQPAAFSESHRRLLASAAHLIAPAIRSAELYGLIADQAEHLGMMLRSQQVEASQSHAILNAIADGVIVTNRSHRVLLFNPAAARILGLPAEQVIGQATSHLLEALGEHGQGWFDILHDWSQATQPRPAPPEQAERMELSDGRVIAIHPAPVLLGEEYLGAVSIFRDITREVEVDRLKSEFVATVSHELRTPMTSIKGFLDLLLMGVAGELDTEQRRYLNIVRQNTERLEMLVVDLLDLSRIEAGKVQLHFQPLEVAALLSELQQYVEHRCQEEEKRLSVHLETPSELPRLWGDPERVRQILANLVDNAYSYTPTGGEVWLRARAAGAMIEIEVTDTGIGISLEEQARIFERFYRGEQALIMGVSGAGLGLSIALHMVEMHGGRLWVTSEGIPGKGSTFTLALPAARPDGSGPLGEES